MRRARLLSRLEIPPLFRVDSARQERDDSRLRAETSDGPGSSVNANCRLRRPSPSEDAPHLGFVFVALLPGEGEPLRDAAFSESPLPLGSSSLFIRKRGGEDEAVCARPWDRRWRGRRVILAT